MSSEAYPASRISGLKPAWQAGQSGNALGGHKQYRITLKRCRVASIEMAERLIECANDKNAPWPARISAAVSVLDRAWGKPKETLDVGGAGIGAILRIEIIDAGGQTETITISNGHDQQPSANGHDETTQPPLTLGSETPSDLSFEDE